ncbi:MAG: tetratricopeptide repeat protein, partial [Candidatus Omnitrophica bacterium]|nr:tetratricopeptide repeat protein [Candidatus Omnitrophota bacterium]
NVKAAHLEYILAASMAIQTHDPSFVFRIRQAFADDFYDHGFLDEAVKRGYICMDSDYPLETCWALGLEIVYKWSNDDLTGVSESVSRLSTLLPQTVPNPDSDWERRRYEQASFLFSTAENALAGDQLSRMILDVEATEFHYKRGEITRGMERLKPWLQAYPTNELMTFTPEEQDWALWVKHNYALLLSGMNRNEEAETLLSEVVNTVDSQQHAAHVARAWCTLGRCYWLEGKHEKAVETIERGLDMDAEDTLFIPPGLTDLRRQPRLRDAKMDPDVRAGMVQEYKILKSRLEGE